MTMLKVPKSWPLRIVALVLGIFVWSFASVARGAGTGAALGAYGLSNDASDPTSAAATGDSSGQNDAGASDSNGEIGPASQSGDIGNLTSQQVDQSMDAGSAGLPTDQMRQMCAAIAEKHLSPSDLDQVGSSLGLSPDQISQLKNCSQGQSSGTIAQSPRTNPASLPNQRSAKQPGGSAPLINPRQSSIELSMRGLASGKTTKLPMPAELEQFGYSAFARRVSTFAPVGEVPVSDDYILGPGDNLNVLFWGRFNNVLTLPVQRDGSVLIQQVGPLQVAGLTFGEASKLIESQSERITGVKSRVTMGRLRTIQVFLLGEVAQPGAYTVSSLAHVSNAILAAGGVNKLGSLRRVELRRGNGLVEQIDLYDMLLRGNTAADARLEQGDTIFVPVIGPVAGVMGAVKRPAIYELDRYGDNSLRNVLAMAGGFGPFGYSQMVQVERTDDHLRRVTIDVDFTRVTASRFRVQDGDLVKVLTVLPQQEDVVTLKGNVNRPGVYQWRSGMTVADLVRRGEGVTDNTFFSYALIRRVEGPDRRPRFLPVNLGKALEDPDGSDDDVILQSRDVLTIYNERELGDLPRVTVIGAIRKMGSYPLTERMRVSDLVYEAGGLQDNAFFPKAELARTEIVNGKAVYIYQDVDLRQALRKDVVDGIDGAGDPTLRRGDMLLIQQASNWHLPWIIRVEGEVMRPGPYVIHEGERLDSILERCGGLREDAYLPATVFIRKSVKELEQQRLDESRQRLQAEVARLSLMPTQTGASDNSKANLGMVQRLLADTNGQQAVGRIALTLVSMASISSSENDLVLQDGDRLIIPKRPASVAVLGEVYNPGALIYQPGQTVGDYLAKAGGPSQWADKDHILLVRANGEVLTDEGIRSTERNRTFPLLPVISGGLMEAQLQPGDTVYVPEQLVYVSGLQYATAVTQIVVNAATSLAVVGILASSL
jgi:protein involved in polysaccharide export with SLBB domain